MSLADAGRRTATRERPRPLRTRPTVSVVVPCYNYGRYLPDCVASILAQDGVDVDVLIVDDASPDGSVEVARQLAADPRVRVIEHVVNRGHIATYNEGLAKATGDYVVLLSADDLLTPGSLARSTALLEAHPEVGFVYGFSAAFDETPPAPRTRVDSWSIWPGGEWMRENCEQATNPVSTPEVVMRSSMMRTLEGYDGRVPHAADFLLWLRAAAHGHVGRVNGVDQAFYRVHGANMHVQEFGGMVRDIRERAAVLDILFTEEGEPVAELRHLHGLAKAALARTALSLAGQAAGRADPASEAPEDLARLAASIDPEIRATGRWRRYERLLRRGPRRRRPSALRRLAERVDRRLRWGRWRRRGIRV
ncbi:glycosyltransferase [Micromonospora sp. WMMD812]|uniref:glycosyltransferase family 2 protein n=1 Tax=Micromonospora sp. WMMD812 TaxID=3015152 RepID=UPI00248BE52D|nr:glycosyltransferase [Micromonospora sp. WMMD812]WBB69601.1 glycosyltransferase [Micromonospora sp. WMMD812]